MPTRQLIAALLISGLLLFNAGLKVFAGADLPAPPEAETITEEHPVSYTVTPRTPVYAEADNKAEIRTSLPFGTPIKVLDPYHAPGWAQIFFQDTPQDWYLGYIRSQHLSKAFTQTDLNGDRNPELILVGEVQTMAGPGYSQARVAIISQGKLLSESVFTPPGGFEATEASIEALPKSNFVQPARLIKFTLEPQACDYGGGAMLLLWDGQRINATPVMGAKVASAGVFHVETDMVFPQDKEGRPNEVLVKETTSKWNDSLEKYQVESVETTRYLWDGKHFKKRTGS